MRLLKYINKKRPTVVSEAAVISEDAAICADAVAANPTPLFASMIKRPISAKPKLIRYSNKKTNNTRHALYMMQAFGLSEAFIPDKPDKSGFNLDSVMSQLKSLEDKESIDRRDVVSFGLHDSSGNIIKVSVSHDQADSFEQELQHILQYQTNKQDSIDVAEILYELKDRYNIIDVQWPTGTEDAEEDVSKLDSDKKGDKKESEFPNEDNLEDEDFGDKPPLDEMPNAGDQTTDITNLLTQVIDMLKSDAEAKKADAQAREAEAKTRQAIAARDQAKARVSQEEQYLEMDAYNKAQKTKDQEAKRMAQLAKWKHDVKDEKLTPSAQEPSYDFVPGDEDEELLSPTQLKKHLTNKGAELRGKVQPSDIAKYIMNRIK